MNVKPGDLAIIKTSNRRYHGRIVEVLHAAPTSSFNLPDGQLHSGSEPGSWVLKFIGGDALVPMETGRNRRGLYAVGIDAALHPLPGDSEDETEQSPETVSEKP